MLVLNSWSSKELLGLDCQSGSESEVMNSGSAWQFVTKFWKLEHSRLEWEWESEWLDLVGSSCLFSGRGAIGSSGFFGSGGVLRAEFWVFGRSESWDREESFPGGLLFGFMRNFNLLMMV